MPILSRRLLPFILASLAISAPASAAEYNTDKIGGVLKDAHNDLTIVCAHRGLHGTAIGTNSHPDWLRDVPEKLDRCHSASGGERDRMLRNRLASRSKRACGRSARFQPRSDDERVPDRGWHTLRSVYARRIQSNLGAYTGNTLGLPLRKPNLSGYTNQTLPDLAAILDAIKTDKIAMILLLDVKDIEAARRAWQRRLWRVDSVAAQGGAVTQGQERLRTAHKWPV